MQIQSLERRLLLTAYDPDPTFGTAGIASAGVVGSDARDMAVQSDGKVVVVGSAGAGSNESIAVARFHADGTLDTSFSGDGKFNLSSDAGDHRVAGGYSLAIQSDDKILVGGTGAGGGFVLLRLASDGTLDSSFGTSGVSEITDSGQIGFGQILSIHELASGKILAGGVVQQPFGQIASQRFVGLAEYNSDGTLDTSFGNQGTVISNIESVSDGDLMDLQSDGKIVIVGATTGGDSAIARFTAAGAVDATFGTAGVTSMNFATGVSESLVALKVRSDDKIVAVGWHNVPDIQDTQIELLRLTANGALDSTFSSDGRVTIKDSTFDRAESLYIRPDNSILIGGDVITESVVFSLSSGGQFDSSFGFDGQLFFVGAGIPAIQLQQGKIITIQTAGFRSTTPTDLQAIRFGNDNITLNNGTLSITGTSKNDTFFVNGEETEYSVTYNGATSVYDTSEISRIDIEGVGGDDNIGFDDVMVPGTVSGGSGNDTIQGLNGEAQSSGLTLSGGDGDDVLNASTNPSVGLQLDGGNGNDLIKGTNGPDSITGGAGKDTIFGEAGNDRISGNGGKDRINASTGSDRVYGGAGDDQLDGGPGNDRIFGQAGNDKLFGGKGNDQLDGGPGADIFIANAGDDSLFSADGEADRLDGGSGNNTATIDNGIDSIIRVQTVQ